MSYPEFKLEPPHTDPVSELFYRISGIVSNHILLSKVKPKTEKGVEIPVFNFNNWEVEYLFYKEHPESKNFEIILRILDEQSWISKEDIILSLFQDGGTNIKLKDMRGNQSNLSSKDIKSEETLKEELSKGTRRKTLEAFQDLDLVSLI